MTDEEIRKIAREYAEEYSPKEYIDPILREKAVELNSNIFAEFLQHLSKTHCIVPKKSVSEFVNDIEFFMPDKRSVTMLRIGAKSLFGKSLFNEDNE